jgi:CheY-like chemotaxis protein
VCRLLFVEDQFSDIEDGIPVLKQELEKRLKRAVEYEVVTTIAETEQRLKQCQDDPPSAIVLDMMLPINSGEDVDMTGGIRLLSKLRTKFGSKIAEVPVLILTARSVPQLRATVMAGNRVEWMEKPAHPREVATKIATLLGPHG